MSIPQDREPPEGYDGDTLMVSGAVLLDHEEHMVEAHDVDEDHAEQYFEDVMTQVMLLEQNIPEVDWDQEEIRVITNTLLGFAHQNTLLREQSNPEKQKWVHRLITGVFLAILIASVWSLAITGVGGSILSYVDAAIAGCITFLFLARE